MNYKFKVGDKIRVLDGSKIEDYTGCWTKDMFELIGKTYEIRRSFLYPKGKKPAYKIKDEHGHFWTIDERGAELSGAIPIEEKITIRDEYSKNGNGCRHIVTATQNTEYGVLIGKAICHPEDKFDYDFGVTLALGRLLQAKKKAKKLEELKKKKNVEKFVIYKYTTTGYICW